MKKIARGLFSVFVFIVMIACLGVYADPTDPAGSGSIIISGGGDDTFDTPVRSILSLNVSVDGNSLIIGGKTEEGMLAVAVGVYDKSGKNLVTMRTTGVNDDNVYETTIDVEDGTYVIKAADYNGGEYLTKSITVGTPKETPKEDTDTSKDKKSKTSEKSKKAVVSEDKNNTDVEESKEEKVQDTETKEDKKVYFPKTDDNMNYFLIMASLGIIVSICISILIKKKVAKSEE